ncbi:MAG: SAM-dependent methyltransferase [Candidatus Cloacimonetes bacterium]|nr:SAM-dependent methyltransferase [Candidatus Cloacimonadota bacterium]
MKQPKNILSQFDFENHTISLDDDNLSKPQYDFIRNEVKEKININSIYFSGDYASVYFKTISSFSPENLKEICLLHKSIWNQRKVPLLFVSTPTEVRIYNCFEEPINPEEEIEKLNNLEIEKYSEKDTQEHLNKLVPIFGRVAIDSGKFWKEQKIAEKFNPKKRVDTVLINNLKATKEKIRKRKIDDYIIHDILIRSLFILYLEDIGASDANLYDKFKVGAKSYFDLLTEKSAAYDFFEFLNEKFNGNLFPVTEIEKKKITGKELHLISACYWGEDVNRDQLTFWKKFDFSIIPIELISEIYEIFLNKTDKQKSKSGEYYTPHSLVDFILNEKLPWADEENKNYDLKILDIACGSGIFLVESYRRLVDRWRFSNQRKPGIDNLRKILLNSIYGFEINPEAIKVASFSLYLALISYLEPKTIWRRKDVKFPYIIFDPQNGNKNQQGYNLYLQSSLSNTIEKQPKFDLVIGNPPFKSAKTGSIEPEARQYCKERGFAQEMVLPFLDRASYFCNDDGKAAIISTSKILFNKSGGYKKFRQFLLQKNYVEAVFNFSALRKARKGQGKSIFAHAVGPACVLFYRKNEPKQKRKTVTYVCPKPTVRDQFSDDLILDSLDFYYLPRYECEKPDSVIWKTAMWGTENDFQLIQTLSNMKPLNHYLTEKNGWYKGEGFQFLYKKEKKHWSDNELSEMKVLEAKNVQRYFTPKNLVDINNSLSKKNIPFYLKLFDNNDLTKLPRINIFRMIGKKETYFAPHLLLKRGQSQKQLCASFLEYDCSFKHAIYGLSFKKKGLSAKEKQTKNNLLKSMTAYFNSKFTSYYLFLSAISWGVEREEVNPNEMLSLPALPFEISYKQINELAEKVNEISAELKKDIFRNDEKISKIENEIDEIIYKVLNLTKREQYLIEDIFNYGIDLFQEGANSAAYSPLSRNHKELKAYLRILCEDINEHFSISDTTVWASIPEMPSNIPMQLAAIHFTNEHKAGHIHTFSNSDEVNKIIHVIDKDSYRKHSASVYFRKVYRFYERDVLYIIKPNEKRFWSRSRAMQDSNSILLEIANIEKE